MPLAPLSFPHIWDTIIANSDVKTLLALRATTFHLHRAIDRVLLSHLTAHPTCWATCFSGCKLYDYMSGAPRHSHFLVSSTESGFLRAPWSDGAVRIPIPPTPDERRRKFIRSCCHRLGLHGNLTRNDINSLGRLVTPQTLLLTPFLSGCVVGLSFSVAKYALETIPAPTAIISLEYPPEVREGDRIDVVDLPDCTRRIVLHQYAFGWGNEYLFLRGAGLVELVLVFLPEAELDPGRMNQDGVEGRVPNIPWYLSELIPKLPEVAFTIVGVEDVRPSVDTLTLSARFQDARLEFRTRAEHQRALGPEQWALEMEL